MKKRVLILLALVSILVSGDALGQGKRRKLILSSQELWALYSESKDFYGLFVKQKLLDNFYQYDLRKINIKDYVPQPEIVNYEKVKNDNLIYVFLGFDSLTTNIKGWKFDSDYLLPGQSLLAGGYHIYAKGETIETIDSASMEVFDAVDNYRIGLKTKFQEKIIDQNITEGYRLTRWSLGNYFGGIKVDWVGDLDGDGRLEIIMIECGHHECFDVVLYSPDKNFKIREVHRNTVCGG